MREFLRAAIVLIGVGCIAVPSHAFIDDANGHNTISEQDEGKIVDLWTRVLDFSKDLSQIMLAIASSETLPNAETYRTIFCIQQINTQARVMERDLYRATVAAQMSYFLQYRLDEKLTLDTVKTLEQTASYATFARGELNKILGGCGRQRRLAYDKATSLLTLIEEVGKVVAPMLQRVEFSMLQRN